MPTPGPESRTPSAVSTLEHSTVAGAGGHSAWERQQPTRGSRVDDALCSGHGHAMGACGRQNIHTYTHTYLMLRPLL